MFASIIYEGFAVVLLVFGFGLAAWLHSRGSSASWIAFVPSAAITALVGIRILVSSVRYVGQRRALKE
jgi:hypothetical protein